MSTQYIKKDIWPDDEVTVAASPAPLRKKTPMQTQAFGSVGDVGVKHDSNKLRWSLLPWEQLEPVVRVLMQGAINYGDYNWRKVTPESRYSEALMRHAIAYVRGEKTDPSSGESHLAHIVCNCLFLLWFEKEAKK